LRNSNEFLVNSPSSAAKFSGVVKPLKAKGFANNSSTARFVTTPPRPSRLQRCSLPNASGRTAYAVGFLFKVKVQGWKLFCARLNVSPVALWEQIDLPGVDRLKRALALALAGAAFPSAAEMTL
jgi:hypothetical protein